MTTSKGQIPPGKHILADADAYDRRRKHGSSKFSKKIRLDLEVPTSTPTNRQTSSSSKPESNETPIKPKTNPSDKIKGSAGKQKKAASPCEHEAAQGEQEDAQNHRVATQGEKADAQDHPKVIQGEKTVARAHPKATQVEMAVVQDHLESTQGKKAPTLNKQTPDNDEEAPTPHNEATGCHEKTPVQHKPSPT